MLRTSAPLIGALYVSGLKGGEGRLTDGTESHECALGIRRLFARVLQAGRHLESDGPAIQVRAAVPVSQHAKPCNPKLSRPGGQALLTAASVRWRTSREFCHRERSSVTDMLATQLFVTVRASHLAQVNGGR